MHQLVLHPDCTAGPIRSISAQIHPTESGCEAVFRVEGDMDAIVIPQKTAPERMDNLWKTTCFEIFWQPEGDSYYREFNLSPSLRWACYDFDDFRLNSRDAPVERIEQTCTNDARSLELTASIDSALPLPASVALNAIIETKEGDLQFWALAFADGKPEFHSEVCRALNLAGRL